jgi:hypothetical protein
VSHLKRKRFYIITGLIGLLLRLVLMPFSLHVDPRFGGDLLAINWAAFSFIHNPNYGMPPYPPLAMVTIGLIQSLWLTSGLPQSLSSATQTIFSPAIFHILFSSKTLYLLFDLMTLLLWLRIFADDPHKRRLAWMFWIFNPLVIYDAYVHGQFDLLPVFFLVLSLLFIKEGKPGWAAFWLGIGGCFKYFPLFFLLPLVIIKGKSWREKIILLLLGTIPYVLSMTPFSRQYNTNIGNFPDWFFKAGYDLGFGSQVYFFFMIYAIMLWALYLHQAHTFEDFWRVCFAILLVYYQFSYFDLHYWVWSVPFAILYLVEYPKEARPFYAVIGLFLLVLLAPAPLARFLAPISPRFFLRLPSLMEVLNPYLPMLLILNVVRSLLAGTCFFLAYKLIRGMPAIRNNPGPVISHIPNSIGETGADD